jgi:hypothetical protein
MGGAMTRWGPKIKFVDIEKWPCTVTLEFDRANLRYLQTAQDAGCDIKVEVRCRDDGGVVLPDKLARQLVEALLR